MKKSKAMPANVAAIWGAFLHEGMLCCSQNKDREKAVLDKWGLGCIELMAEACSFLPEVWKHMESRWYSANFPGVFEYEVISPLGVSIGDYVLLNPGNLPPNKHVCEVIEELIKDFFDSHQIASGKTEATPCPILH